MVIVKNVFKIKPKIVVKGIFNLIKLKEGDYFKTVPIIISEFEDINSGDWVYNSLSSSLYQTDDTLSLTKNDFKVLVLPEQFSSKTLRLINDWKLIDGRSVFIVCWTNKEKYEVGLDINYKAEIHLKTNFEKLFNKEDLIGYLKLFKEDFLLNPSTNIEKWVDKQLDEVKYETENIGLSFFNCK